MDRPLISHPNANDLTHEYPEAQLTTAGHLRLDAHSDVVSSRAGRMFGPDDRRHDYLETAAELHDFGKATPQFQAYVRPDECHDGPAREREHARLGALVTWYTLGYMDAPPRDRLAATLAVARHHQALPNVAQYTAKTLARAFDESGAVIQAQINAISDEWPEAAIALLERTGGDGITWSEVAQWGRSGAPAAELREYSARETLASVHAEPSKLPEYLYDRTIHYWSAITLADKSHAMDIKERQLFDLETLDGATLEGYIDTLRQDPPTNDLEAALNDKRERARRQAIRGVHEWIEHHDDSRVATLTLPTGLGKTFTGLSAAFETRDLLGRQGSSSPDSPRPIVYALPYTSIIEQTRAIFEDSDLWGVDPTDSGLTVHHHLSETVVYDDEYEPGDVDDTDAEEIAQLLGESWRDGTILTTFVQLFESLTGPTNRQGLKLPALGSGIVILDEPQALSKDWWDGIDRLLELLTKEFETRVIAMTATQPSLLRDMNTTSLLEVGAAHETNVCRHCEAEPSYQTSLSPVAQESYFDDSARVRYTIDETALTHKLEADKNYVKYGEGADRLHDVIDTADSVLAICNTIESSRQLTTAVCDKPDVTHLGPVIREILTNRGISATGSEPSAGEIATSVLKAVGIDRRTADGAGGDWEFPQNLGTLVLTLNSRYRPFDRQVLIELADRLSTGPVPFIMVSTQAIEAGVDISFEQVFRDIAPLDSIVQAAGRCNRSYEWGEDGGHVVIWTLAPTDEESTTPPAYWVYERGATEDGIPGHLRLISKVLARVDGQRNIPDVELSKHAVDDYFTSLTGGAPNSDGLGSGKSIHSGEIRDRICQVDASWLGQQSLIGGYETKDVVVALTDNEVQELDQITAAFINNDPTAYDLLEGVTSIRISIPADLIRESPNLARIDGKERGAEGTQVFRFTGDEGLNYDLVGGGLQGGKDNVSGRFTVL